MSDTTQTFLNNKRSREEEKETNVIFYYFKLYFLLNYILK